MVTFFKIKNKTDCAFKCYSNVFHKYVMIFLQLLLLKLAFFRLKLKSMNDFCYLKQLTQETKTSVTKLGKWSFFFLFV